MKRVLIGGFLSLIGSIWAMAVLFVAGSNLTSGWTTPPGRFMTTVAEMGLSEVFGMAILFVVLGIGHHIRQWGRNNKAPCCHRTDRYQRRNE